MIDEWRPNHKYIKNKREKKSFEHKILKNKKNLKRNLENPKKRECVCYRLCIRSQKKKLKQKQT